MDRQIIKSNHDNVFLNSVRNAVVLLVVGIALLEFGGKLEQVAPITFILVISLLVVSIYNYMNASTFSQKDYPIILIIVVLIAVCSWLFYQSINK